MVILYMVVLCLSAFLAAWGGARILARMAPIVGLPPLGAALALLSAVAFFIVIGAPPSVLVGTLLMAGVVMRFSDMLTVGAVLLATVMIGLMGVHGETAPYLATLPRAGALALAGLVWVTLAASAYPMGERVLPASWGLMAALGVLLASPYWAPNATWIAFDAAILLAALGGMLLGGTRVWSTATRLGFAYLLAFLIVAALWHGAWMAAAGAILCWGGAAGWSWVRQDPWGDHAL